VKAYEYPNGKLMFTATCMVCHEFHGGGQKVGPDLIGSGRSNLNALLANVIDPNQIIGNGYENFTVSTKDGRTLAGRIVEDTPGQVKLLGAGGAAQVVPRDQIAGSRIRSRASCRWDSADCPTWPSATSFGTFWLYLKKGRSKPKRRNCSSKASKCPNQPHSRKRPTGVPSRGKRQPVESRLEGLRPDFERTPVKLAEYHGKTNVLLMHPFTEKKTPTSFVRKLKGEKTILTFNVAADDRGDWLVKVLVNGQEVKSMTVDHEKPYWKTVEVDLAKWKGHDVTLQNEGHANGWAWEFG